MDKTPLESLADLLMPLQSFCCEAFSEPAPTVKVESSQKKFHLIRSYLITPATQAVPFILMPTSARERLET